MAGQDSILNRHIGAVSDIEKSPIGCTMISFTNDVMLQPIHKNMRPSDGEAPGVVCIFRLRTVGDSCKMASNDRQCGFVDGKSRNFCDLIKIPNDGSIHIDIPVFVDYKNISL
jgi:hypothetical protein